MSRSIRTEWDIPTTEIYPGVKSMSATIKCGRELAMWLRRLSADAEAGLISALSIEFTKGQDARIAVKVDALAAHRYDWMPSIEDIDTQVDVPIPDLPE